MSKLVKRPDGRGARAGKRAVKVVDEIINMALLCLFVLLLLYGGFVFMQSNKVYAAAGAASYAMYRPDGAEGVLSFEALQQINPDVFAWLTVYGTGIDYPVAETDNNVTYLNTDITGEYSVSGSLFLDCGSKPDFSGFNSIVYGHYMEQDAMFGSFGNYMAAGYLDSHPYGNLYFEGKDHGVEFFVFLEADAYDSSVYIPAVIPGHEESYVENLYEKSMYSREVAVSAQDRIVVLSTCTPNSTNGRYLLAGKITDATYQDPCAAQGDAPAGGERAAARAAGTAFDQGLLWRIAIPCILALLVILYLLATRRSKKGRRS